MKLSNSFFYTLRQVKESEDCISDNLLVRAGMIRKSSTGVYIYLPLGYKVLKNIENIIREEMNNIGSLELLMPTLIQEDTYIKSGRNNAFGDDMFKFNDKFDRTYCLAPTHEELFTIVASSKVKSYKDLPFSLYQFQNKFRDETRPRFGLLRVREFIMKDAYSFDTSEEGLDKSYNEFKNAYKKIFARLGLNFKIVRSDVGAMGGSLSEEFQAIADIGEDTIVYCTKCDFSSNIDIAECVSNDISEEEIKLRELIKTEDAKTIKEVSSLLFEKEEKFVKTLIYKIESNYYAVLVRGNKEVNENKLARLMNATNIELATDEEISNLGLVLGYLGPININIPVILDNEIMGMKNFIVGANKKDYHYKNVNLEDFNYLMVADIRNIVDSDKCPNCGAKLNVSKGVEVGNIFKLGTKYSEAFNLNYLDKDNNLNSVVMGSYGIGIGRCLASIVEQKHDDKGIIWPLEVAPYKVYIAVI
ncbi:MAG TPA: proline--tRNA ligase, partial [Bacilli bacterium]|nr:proline--tRNA ligase [Bacilli bacterium]